MRAKSDLKIVNYLDLILKLTIAILDPKITSMTKYNVHIQKPINRLMLSNICQALLKIFHQTSPQTKNYFKNQESNLKIIWI